MHKRKIRTINAGKFFTYAGKQFVVLEQMEDGAFCLLAKSNKCAPFHSFKFDPLKNDYRKSTLRTEIELDWMSELTNNGAEANDFVEFEVDLRPTDQSEGYGSFMALAAPLTLWQYGKYKGIIPFNEDDYWWLVTPWACWRPHFPDTGGYNMVWLVLPDGSCIGNDASLSFGIHPALKLNPELLVYVDEQYEECDKKGECNNYTVELDRVNTLALIRELERRYYGTIELGEVKTDE